MKLLTPKQMKTIDKTAIEKLGIPGIVLMENAAMQVVDKALDLLKKHTGARICVVAGPGNNGGDAFAVARHLLSMGHMVTVYTMTNISSFTGDALTNARILCNLGLEIPVIYNDDSVEILKSSCIESDLIIDGLLGTGLNRDVDGIWQKVIDTINDNSHLILSIDIASGVDGLTGKVRGNCIKADATVTFFLPKLGMVQYPGASYMGELTVADISIPYDLALEYDTPTLLEKDDILGLMPQRPKDAHKGTFGKVLSISGSANMTGAAYLSAVSAYRAGCGLVKMVVSQSCLKPLSILIPEAVFVPFNEKNGHLLIKNEINDKLLLKNLIEDADAILVGPGLCCNNDTHGLLKFVINNCDKPMILDADALNIMAEDKSLLKNIGSQAVITPHPAEMARLTGKSISEVQQDRISISRHFAYEYGLTVVLKGASTVIVSNDGRCAINPTGNEGMATAGSGDVLSGIILSLLGQQMTNFDAACTAVFLHGLAGDLAAREKGNISIMASDIVNKIPDALGHILRLI